MIMCGGRLYEFENGAYYNAFRLHNLVPDPDWMMTFFLAKSTKSNFVNYPKFILEFPDLLSIALHYYATYLMIIKIIDRTTCVLKDAKSSH